MGKACLETDILLCHSIIYIKMNYFGISMSWSMSAFSKVKVFHRSTFTVQSLVYGVQSFVDLLTVTGLTKWTSCVICFWEIIQN